MLNIIKKIIFFFVVSVLAFPSFAKKSSLPSVETPAISRAEPVSRLRKLHSWNIRVSAKELDMSAPLSGNALLMLNGPLLGNTLFVSRKCEPFSLAEARQKVKEWGGHVQTLKIHKSQKFLFYVPKNAKGKPTDSLIWVATNGDCLVANTDRLTKQKYRSLRRRVSRERGRGIVSL